MKGEDGKRKLPPLQNSSDSILNSSSKKLKMLESSNEKSYQIIKSFDNNHISDPHRNNGTIEYPRNEKNVIARLASIEKDQSTNLMKLNKVNDTTSTEIAQLNNMVMTLKTQRANQEFENFKLDDEYIRLKEELGIVKGQIEEIKEHEQESLKSLQNKYELTSKQLRLSHEKKLDSLKESISSQVEKLINENVIRHEIDKQQLSDQCDILEKQIKAQEQDLNRKLIKLKEDHNKKLIQLNNTLDETILGLNSDISITNENEIEKKKGIKILQDELSSDLKNMNTSLTSKSENFRLQLLDKQLEIETLNNSINKTKKMVEEMKLSFQSKSLEIQNLNSKTEELDSHIRTYEMERRLLHNQVQELKGNIRVFCRIKPGGNEKLANLQIPDNMFNDDSNQELLISKSSTEDTGSYSSRGNNSYKFQFDKIFSTDIKNQDIFEEISQLVQSSLDGYNVCVFAYGQTGSGKTFTMSNPRDGMITLSIKKIFEDIQDLQSKNWTYSVEGQFLEIYNESIIDLLVKNDSSLKHDIKHDDVNNKTYVTNITSVNLASQEEAHQILEKASKNRSTASTRANERSSRSHSIFILKLKGNNMNTGEVSEGSLNLIDLAGSERLSQSQAKGDRLKETQAINKSLSSLGDVIYALGQHQNSTQGHHHIPYRNSKLTYLLKHSLGGNSKTLMFVNISPLLRDLNETVNSLRFATKVNNTKLGKL